MTDTNSDDEPKRRKKPDHAPRPKGTGSIFKMANSKFWWISYISGGRKQSESTKSTIKQVAQDLLTSRLGDVSHGIVVTPKMGRITLGAALTALVNNQRMNGRTSVRCDICHVACCGVKGHSHGLQRQIDKHLLPFFPPNRLMNAIATSDLTAFVAHRLEQGAAPATINLDLATLRRAFRLAVRGGELMTMPYIPMLTLNNVRKGFFERHEFEAVREALPAALRGLVTFAYLSGWRTQAELLPLQWAQVDRAAKVVRLEPGTTKNREGRTLPYGLLPELVDVIDQQWEAHERLQGQGVICPYVFHRDGKPIKTFRGAWKVACEAAGCPGKHIHDFRRTTVRNLVRARVSEKTAMLLTGHKTRSVFDRYDIVNEADLRTALGDLGVYTTEQRAKADAAPTGQVQRFAARR